MRDIKIKDVPLVESLTGQEKIPVSDGSGSPKAINVGQIFKTLHINTFSVTYTITEDMVGQEIQLFGGQLGGDPTALLYFGTASELKPSTNIPITGGMYTFSKAGEYTFYIQAKPDISFAGSFAGKNYIKKIEFRNCDICDYSFYSFSQICQSSSVEEFVLENVVFRNKFVSNNDLGAIFGGCTNLKTVIFDNITFKTAPSSISGLVAGSSLETLTIRNCNFRGVSQIHSFAPNNTTKYINFTDCVISKECECQLFAGSQALLEIDLSNTNLYSLNYLFAGCTSLQKIIMTGIIEGEANGSTFGGVPAGCELYYDSGNIRNSNILEVASALGLVLIDVSNHLTKDDLTEYVKINDLVDHSYVNLGLPSGTLWASCNVGANSPEEYGGYYAWGETEEKEDYSWETYKWCNGTYDTLTKYCTNSDDGTVDNRTTLTSSDDVATVKWGNNWRIPTEEEIRELNEYCTQAQIVQNGVKGTKFTGPNGNSIFLPAAGLRHSMSLFDNDTNSFYWSATLYESGSYNAWNILCNNYSQTANNTRYLGLTIRPVMNTQTILSNYYTKEEIDEKVPTKEDLTEYVKTSDLIAHEGVDLGLSSGTLWATCNVGATSPEEYGGYYAWGETEEKNDYSPLTYKYYLGDLDGDGYYDDSNEYTNIGSNISGTQYDVAHEVSDGKWRMPTKEEFKELVEECTWQWTTYNGVNGQLVTGPNGNSIFLPATGRRLGTGVEARDSLGEFWYASLSESSNSSAYHLGFLSNGVYWNNYSYRYYGRTVRPVMNKLPILNNYYTKEETDKILTNLNKQPIYETSEDSCYHNQYLTMELDQLKLKLKMYEISKDSYYHNQYLTMEFLEDGDLCITSKPGHSSDTITDTFEYSINGADWSFPSEYFITVKAGDKVRWKGDGISLHASTGGYNSMIGCFYTTSKYKVYGNIMSLVAGDDFVDKYDLTEYGTGLFHLLFYENEITDASNLILPATTLSEVCYDHMFYQSGIYGEPFIPPKLPATTLAYHCYDGMFCSANITNLPELPATELVEGCYAYMFANTHGFDSSSKLTLPARNYQKNAYAGMIATGPIKELTLFTKIPLEDNIRLYSEILNISHDVNIDISFIQSMAFKEINEIGKSELNYHYQYLTFEPLQTNKWKFTNDIEYSLDNGATWIALPVGEYTPEVSPGNTIMWRGDNISINESTASSSTALGIGCFMGESYLPFNVSGNIMSLVAYDKFYDKYDLTEYGSCLFANLFLGCRIRHAKNLILPAKKLSEACYYQMFHQCGELLTAPELPATELSKHCYYNMFNGCGYLYKLPSVLPAITLKPFCYSYMFANGGAFSVKAPEIKAQLYDSIDMYGGTPWYGMFAGVKLKTLKINTQYVPTHVYPDNGTANYPDDSTVVYSSVLSNVPSGSVIKPKTLNITIPEGVIVEELI